MRQQLIPTAHGQSTLKFLTEYWLNGPDSKGYRAVADSYKEYFAEKINIDQVQNQMEYLLNQIFFSDLRS